MSAGAGEGEASLREAADGETAALLLPAREATDESSVLDGDWDEVRGEGINRGRALATPRTANRVNLMSICGFGRSCRTLIVE